MWILILIIIRKNFDILILKEIFAWKINKVSWKQYLNLKSLFLQQWLKLSIYCHYISIPLVFYEIKIITLLAYMYFLPSLAKTGIKHLHLGNFVKILCKRLMNYKLKIIIIRFFFFSIEFSSNCNIFFIYMIIMYSLLSFFVNVFC